MTVSRLVQTSGRSRHKINARELECDHRLGLMPRLFKATLPDLPVFSQDRTHTPLNESWHDKKSTDDMRSNKKWTMYCFVHLSTGYRRGCTAPIGRERYYD